MDNEKPPDVPIRFERTADVPVVSRTEGTFYSVHAANPDVLEFGREYLFVFRGQDESGRDQIGVGRCDREAFDGRTWHLPPEPSIRVNEDPEAFDSAYVLDPAAVEVDGILRVYYTGHRKGWSSWNVPSHVGLAFSSDGQTFEKHPIPVMEGMAPEIVRDGSGFVLFFQRLDEARRMHIFSCRSDDGIHFRETDVVPVLGPVAGEAWDSRSISTVRICQDGDHYYMFYGGCRRWPDYPEAIGLARSRDLADWERYTGNPVFVRGEPGTWDEGALWFATVERIDGHFHMWYEGVGADLCLRGPERQKASTLCRQEDYGGYAQTAFSQIGHAVLHKRALSW
jgi:predicted GH43/DUF377 family glycosyl hydrolase